MDFHEPYLRVAFAFIGINDIEFVRAEGVAVSDEQKAEALKSTKSGIDTVGAKAA